MIYEVNLSLNRDIAPEFKEWLQRHIDEMLSIEGFLEAQVFEEEAESEKLSLCVHYRLKDAAVLEHYLKNHAPRMREDGLNRFGAQFSATRRNLTPLYKRIAR